MVDKILQFLDSIWLTGVMTLCGWTVIYFLKSLNDKLMRLQNDLTNEIEHREMEKQEIVRRENDDDRLYMREIDEYVK